MQKITVLCVGKLKEKFYQEAAAEYAKRLGRHCKLEIIELPESRLPEDLLGQHAGACAEVVYSCHNELSLSCITKHRLFCDAFWIISVAVVYRFCGHENKSIFAQRYCRKSPCAGTKHTNVRRAKTKTETTVKTG